MITSKANEPDKQSTVRSIICLDYDDLSSAKDDIVGKVGEAFGYEGLGILAVRNVPNLQKLREKLLSVGRHFAEDLPEETRKNMSTQSHIGHLAGRTAKKNCRAGQITAKVRTITIPLKTFRTQIAK